MVSEPIWILSPMPESTRERIDKSALFISAPVPVRDQAYRDSANGHVCDVPGCERTEDVVLAHIRAGHRTGAGQKPSDDESLFLCFEHHNIQETGGEYWLASLLVAQCRARYRKWRKKRDSE